MPEDQKDAFTVQKDGKDFVMIWTEVQKGSNKGEKFPSLDMEVHDVNDLVAFFGNDQTKLVLGARARQSSKSWYDSVLETFGTFTDSAREAFVRLVQEGKLARITMSELNDQIQAKFVASRDAAVAMVSATDPAEKLRLGEELAKLVQEADALEEQKKSLKRTRKKKTDNDEDEDASEE